MRQIISRSWYWSVEYSPKRCITYFVLTDKSVRSAKTARNNWWFSTHFWVWNLYIVSSVNFSVRKFNCVGPPPPLPLRVSSPRVVPRKSIQLTTAPSQIKNRIRWISVPSKFKGYYKSRDRCLRSGGYFVASLTLSTQMVVDALRDLNSRTSPGSVYLRWGLSLRVACTSPNYAGGKFRFELECISLVVNWCFDLIYSGKTGYNWVQYIVA